MAIDAKTFQFSVRFPRLVMSDNGYVIDDYSNKLVYTTQFHLTEDLLFNSDINIFTILENSIKSGMRDLTDKMVDDVLEIMKNELIKFGEEMMERYEKNDE